MSEPELRHSPLEAEHRSLGAHLSAPDGVWVLDDSGFPKQGTHSVGVGHQYCGQVGKVTNCQTGVFLAYVSSRGHALVDARLYLPRDWIADPAGLFVADFDLLARLPGLETLDLVCTAGCAARIAGRAFGWQPQWRPCRLPRASCARRCGPQARRRRDCR
jgi:hypothetical protein